MIFVIISYVSQHPSFLLVPAPIHRGMLPVSSLTIARSKGPFVLTTIPLDVFNRIKPLVMSRIKFSLT